MRQKSKSIRSDHEKIEGVNVIATMIFAAALVIMIAGAFVSQTLLELFGWTAFAVCAVVLAILIAFLAGAADCDMRKTGH